MNHKDISIKIADQFVQDTKAIDKTGCGYSNLVSIIEQHTQNTKLTKTRKAQRISDDFAEKTGLISESGEFFKTLKSIVLKFI